MSDALTALSAQTSRASLGRMVNQSTILLMVSIGSLILLLALLILFHQNATATKGYQLRNLERERSQLLLEEEILNMQVAESQALHRLSSDPVVQAMVAVKRPLYIEEDTTVASVQDPNGIDITK
ncbi:MAG TPA: hypothetical protein DEB30_02520 [Candidatus Peribacter riflensis]|uniref:Cell division protein FtsL n=1 Tax=Candidatus Peribacter riflensis TaxID=1735162 RepID=A0A0S1SJ33_9BACT|nr:MAG: hypothetical protein PeribacterA2_0518 [Candidatus Peribacter riflensis]OGJ77055.1 MAG: hypothetical protein A2398_02915 [Candidatus Peribacteria bacterium RIFOXYB1_FULL_57_12]ALM11000.1 MAG: hypothetical protein PeribacterB2_0517 [Candidatus Peribacter riflensis]ALM12103.1 MAG: hypothetical protein PeribacterC2_0517 [Candidatus Peribacter riflensis]ALM13206.1 MAG: hypothetical protein PeribacterD1_0518 [Candidatus Peribacter riflensis]